MLGFSLQKILLLIAIIAAVWYGFKFISRLDQSRKAEAKLRKGGGGRTSRWRAPRRERASVEAEEMVQCAVCKAFVPLRASSNCGRADCPY